MNDLDGFIEQLTDKSGLHLLKSHGVLLVTFSGNQLIHSVSSSLRSLVETEVYHECHHTMI